MSGNIGAQDRNKTLEVPQNLYGLFLVEPLQMKPSVDGWLIIALLVCRAWFFILVTYFVQATYIVRLHVINHDMTGEQCTNDLHLQVTCIFVLTAAGFQELREIIDFASLLYWLPVIGIFDGYQKVETASARRDGEVFNAEAEAQAQRSPGFRSALWRLAARGSRKNLQAGEKLWRLQGASRLWKGICACIVVLPRLIICMALVRFASGFLMRKPEESMVVDTVAALFVLEISGFLFNAFTTDEVKQQLVATEGIKIVTSQWHRIAMFVFVHFVYPLLCVGFAVGMVYYLRGDCTDETSFFASLASFDSWKAVLSQGFEHEYEQ